MTKNGIPARSRRACCGGVERQRNIPQAEYIAARLMDEERRRDAPRDRPKVTLPPLKFMSKEST